MAAHVISNLDVHDGMGDCLQCRRRVAVVFLPDPDRPGGHLRACPFDNPVADAIQAAVSRTFSPVPQESGITVKVIDDDDPPATAKIPRRIQKGHPERDIQEAIVKALEVCGCIVMQTSAWRQRGPSGVTPGIPDLLVRWPGLTPGYVLGIEVKAPNGRPTPEQRQAEANGFIVAFVRSPKQALEAVYVLMHSVNSERSQRNRIQAMIEDLS